MPLSANRQMPKLRSVLTDLLEAHETLDHDYLADCDCKLAIAFRKLEKMFPDAALPKDK